MDDDVLISRVLHLRRVEGLSQRQMAKVLGIDRKRIRRILKDTPIVKVIKKSIIEEYSSLILQWYKQYPQLQMKQIYQRLKSYEYKGSYATVMRFCNKHHKPKQNAYHPLVFLPGEEGQVDWMFFNHERLGQVAGFVYVLSYSRYAWGMFYRKHTFEFFLAGHLECFKHIGGLAHCHRYDNLKSVVIRREPQIEYNAQFLDFANFYGFKLHVCNPYSGNEKGRVERLIRDVRVFLGGESFVDLNDLNQKFHQWLGCRNSNVHRATGKTPKELLSQERLRHLPEHPYPASRVCQAVVSKTALVEFETNKYSVPTSCVSKPVEIAAYPGHIEIYLYEQKVAIHERCFGRMKTIQNPLHAERLLEYTPQFKMKRVLQLINGMDPYFSHFIEAQDDDIKRTEAAYQIFTLLRTHSKAMLASAVRELNGMKCFKVKALMSLLHLPQPKEGQVLWPQDQRLLNLSYQERKLNDYDPN
jgi:transposase